MNQHYVPRVYLKNFAEQRGKAFYVDVYDKVSQKIFNTNITNICSERDFYTLDQDSTISENKLIVEKVYSDGLEPIYDKAYRLLTDDNVRVISNLQRSEILIGIFQLYVRNPKMMETSMVHHQQEITQLCEHAKANHIKGITYLSEDFSFREWDEQSISAYFSSKLKKIFKEKHLNGIGEIGTFHEDARLEVNSITGTSKYLTSDNPLIFQDIIDREDDYPLSRSKDFYLPLNSKYTLRIYHDKNVPLNIINRIQSSGGNALLNNSDVFKHASRFIIGNKAAMQTYLEAVPFLEDTSLAVKMDAIRQVVEQVPFSGDDAELGQLFKYYLSIYDTQGTLTPEQESNFYREFRAEQVVWKKSKI
jgi:hypothetical protein